MRRAVLLPAAGASSRMRGRDKLLEDVGGLPCLCHMARAALASADHVIVTLPQADHPRAKALAGLSVETVLVPDHTTGMSASLRAGAEAAQTQNADALMVLPADMPDLAACLPALWQAYSRLRTGQILRATTSQGQAGHPVIFPSNLLSGFQTLTGDTGAAPILQRCAPLVQRHPLPHSIARHDLNTPEDWRAWRQTACAEE